ncbi:MAG: hypothetical protein MJ188_03865 [Treponema sp.]|nr:hypothetical protein [Treponema sp.]
MDNDNKIKSEMETENQLDEKELIEIRDKKELTAKDFIPSQQIHREVRMFLDSELATLHQQAEIQTYNLEEEYAKTKKHKSHLSWVILFVCFIVVVATVFIITSISSRNDKNVTVELSEFDDLNLKSLLDTVSKVQANYDDSVKNRTSLLNDKEVALRAAEAKKLQDEFVIESLKLSAKEEKARLETVQKEYESAVTKINNDYEPRIKALESEIQGYEKQLKEYDAEKIEAAQAQERLLNSERRVQELERKKLAQQYETRIDELEKTIEDLRSANNDDMFRSITALSEKYQEEINGLDPQINDLTAEDIITRAKSMKNEAFDASVFDEVDNFMLESSVEKYQALYDDYNYLDKTVTSLPQKNSIPSYVQASRTLVDNLGQTFTKTTLSLYKDNVKKDSTIDWLEEELDGIYDEYNELVDDYNDTVDNYDAEIAALKTKHSNEKEAMNKKHKEEMHQQEVTLTETLTTKLTNEKNQALDLQQSEYEKCLDTIITAAKVLGTVEKINSKDDIHIYILPAARPYITDLGIPCEIKAAKSIKGTVVKATEEVRGKNVTYFKFVPAKDKAGATIPFDFASVKTGLPVKINVKIK